jgi:dissimilatory sulfite reductase (desulfoviridin) alpha/beta subunit
MASLPWDKTAEKELKKVPFFARPLVRRKVEEQVAKRGGERVTLADYREAEERMKSVMGGHSSEDLKLMIPVDNQAGVPVLALQVCHHRISNCPNVLIQTDEWKKAVEDWAAKNDISEKLRKRISGDTIYFHQKLHLSISGCPNACSRPQIADIGVTGFVTPVFNPEKCNGCGDCVAACPDGAITMAHNLPVFDPAKCLGCTKCKEACGLECISVAPAEARISMGGKLGRHPRLAEPAGKAATPQQLIEIVDAVVKDYLKNSNDGERFADFWARTHK